MKKSIFLSACLFISSMCFGQFTPYGLGLVQQPNAASARNYLGIVTGGGTNSGTVTNFSSGNLSPLFTASVATPTTFPKLTFSQVSQGGNLIFASPNGAPGNPTFRTLVGADTGAFTNHNDVSGAMLSPGDILAWSGGQWTNGPPAATGGGSGTVTSFSAGTLSPLFTTSVATPTTTPALSFAQVSQNANLIFASPNGASGNPTFRALVSADIPALAYVTSVGLSLPVSVFSVSGSPVTSAGTLTASFQNQSANTIFAGPSSGGATTPTFRAAVPADIGVYTNHSDMVNANALSSGDIYAYNALTKTWTNGPPAGTGAGGGSVTSVGFSAPQEFSVSGSPVTTSGTITIARANDANFLGFGLTNASTVCATNLKAQVITNTGNASAPFVYTDANGKHKVGIVGLGLTFDAPSGTLSNSNPNQVSLPGLLTRPVSATATGTLQAPTWPDDDTYHFDEEFDNWTGSSSSQFGLYKWTVSLNGGGGIVVNVASNLPPYYGIVDLQSPTTAGNTAVVSQYGSTGILPYQNLGTSSNWLFHCVFFLHVTNQGSIYRIGLEDFGFNAATTSMNPSNSLMLRWDKNKNDPNNFVFEARSNATITIANSTIRPAQDKAFKLTMFSTNAGSVCCAINGESWVTLTNIPITGLNICFMDATTNAVAQHLYVDRLSFMASSMGR